MSIASFVKNYWINSINYDSWQQDYSIQTLDQTLNQYSLSLEHVMKNFHIANGILTLILNLVNSIIMRLMNFR